MSRKSTGGPRTSTGGAAPRTSTGGPRNSFGGFLGVPSSSTTPTKPPPFGQQRTPKVAVFAAANRLQGSPHRNISGNSLILNTSAINAAAAAGGGAGVPLVVETSRYEEWMKIATDNKITSTNTWNLALIDYFHDMRLLRNGDDNSINFQKASCTLDGCVKIWTSRVDSVATETGKLLSGLAEDGRQGADDMDDNDSDGDGEEGETRRTKKKTKAQAATLADSFSKIAVKSLELEFTVDPLFKKTSADFDEGGAGGILMNHLGCDGEMKVVFDAGDAKLSIAEEDVIDDDEKKEEEKESHARLDIGRLIAKYIPSLPALENKTLCPSLSSFRFSPDATLDLDILNPTDDILPAPRRQLAFADPVDGESGIEGQGMALNDDVYDDFGGGGDDNDGGDDFFADLGQDTAMNGSGAWASSSYGEQSGVDGTGEVDGVELSHVGGDSTLFEDLDRALGKKNWAGPEHWKMRRVTARKPAGDESTTAAKQRKEKVAFVIDFDEPAPTPFKEIFAPAATMSTIQTAARKTGAKKSLTNESATAKQDAHILPDDFHFNGDLLLRLFLKPRTTLTMRRRGGGMGFGNVTGTTANGTRMSMGGAGLMEDEDGQVAYQFGEDMGGMDDDDMGGDMDFGMVPFATQGFLEDEDDADLGYPEDEEEDDLIQATQGTLRRVRPEQMNYEKRAKRVDVKKLKDTIWKELEVVTIPVKEFPKTAVYTPEEAPVDEPRKPEPFVPVLSGLRKAYPEEKMKEISTSFCFICLLHLANEKGLRIQTQDVGEEDDGLLERRSVGGLDTLRVFREIAA
ncbi:hypothetical protein MNV49_003466 [Pseudohyphozyma bogoriensis]|nr:hypothetical protein MNV49_003466 [Pseudohyphozyma bogoriensis]